MTCNKCQGICQIYNNWGVCDETAFVTITLAALYFALNSYNKILMATQKFILRTKTLLKCIFDMVHGINFIIKSTSSDAE